MGASDYFSRPFDARIVISRVRNIAMFEQDYIDQVTGGYNRKAFIRQVGSAEKRETEEYILLF